MVYKPARVQALDSKFAIDRLVLANWWENYNTLRPYSQPEACPRDPCHLINPKPIEIGISIFE